MDLKPEIGITARKEHDFPGWYSQVLTKGEMIEYYDISGCYILRPNSYFVWEQIQHFVNEHLRRVGVRNAYFPMLVSEKALQTEADHVQGFSPEVAWVTKAGKKDLHLPIAIRPTSETVVYPAYAKWIRSHRDLPLRLNQWSNVVRWEFKNPTPFIRTREFLWQEGHSAFATEAEADTEVCDILALYARVYEELLAVPVIQGLKTETEKFPGAAYTATIETFIAPAGRAVQAATSHGLGQNFGKIFGIEYVDKLKHKRIPYQNSWGISTRAIGVMIMQHGDNKGLVIPPRVAATQVVVVPISRNIPAGERARFDSMANDLFFSLKKRFIRVDFDDRAQHTPGWKFNHWEWLGVPLRVEFGPNDMNAHRCVLVRRDTGVKETCPLDNVEERALDLLGIIQTDMLAKARGKLASKQRKVHTWQEFVSALDDRCFVLAPSCDDGKCEESIKEKTRETVDGEEEKMSGSAKSLCIPFDQPEMSDGTLCVGCSGPAAKWTLFGRSY